MPEVREVVLGGAELLQAEMEVMAGLKVQQPIFGHHGQ
jgi:hypothetical protein